MEHLRRERYQWVDSEVCIVWNTRDETVEVISGSKGDRKTTGTLTEALAYVGPKCADWLVILRIPAIVA